MSRLAHHAAVALLVFSPCALAAAANPEAAACYQLILHDPPRWITSGAAWDPENKRLLLVDPTTDRVVSYNLLVGEGETVSELSADLRPVKIARAGDGFLLELADGSMLSLDRRLAVTEKNLDAKLSPTSRTSLFQWASAKPGTFAAFASVVHDQYGFYSSQNNSPLQLLLPADEHQKDFFSLGYPFLAADSETKTTFFLSMAKHPTLYRVKNGKAEKLSAALPPQYATRPDFKSPPVTGPSSAIARFAELETFSIPAGLYAQDGYLYLLTREPAGKDETAWWLYQIDPAGAGRVRGSVRLPSNAPHLTVIPTPDRGWMLIERGKVELVGKHQEQKIGPVVVVSNAAIRSLSAPTSCPVGGGILWADQMHSRALFVPAPLVASGMALPVDDSSQSHLDLRRIGEPKGASPCDFLEPSMGQGTLSNASDLKNLVISSPVAVVGKILSTEPGWDARLRHVVTKVNLEVTHSLKGPLNVGGQVDFLSPGGSMFLADKRVCTSPRKGFYQPRVGDEIVVAAEPSTADSRLLESPYVFPLSRGKIQPEPYPALLSEQKPLALSKLVVLSPNGAY
jgi:hypothetical protein